MYNFLFIINFASVTSIDCISLYVYFNINVITDQKLDWKKKKNSNRNIAGLNLYVQDLYT